MKKFFNKDAKALSKELNSNLENGLNKGYAKKLLQENGENALRAKGKKSIFSMIAEQFKDFMIIILIIAAIISIALGDHFEGFVILGIVILNAVLGVYQENRASNALEALKSMAAPKAKVIRDGNIDQISSKQVVVGDIILLDAGDYVPADIRIFESVNLKIDESALTGESVAVEKTSELINEEEVALGDRTNCGFMSTIVTYGHGKGIVTNTAMNTEIGHIATMLDEQEDTQTPLQKNLADFGKVLGIICIVVCVVIFALGVSRGDDVFTMFMTAISLAVAAIPEGLPAVVTVVLAMGMQKMVKRNAIMKRLAAVETLGSTSVICTDKTGTLTQNKMFVKKVFNGRNEWDVTGKGYEYEGQIIAKDKNSNSEIKRLLEVAVLCNDAQIKDKDVIGDPTEGALITLGAKAGMLKSDLNKQSPRLNEFPFDSDRKLMSTLHYLDEYIMLTKGAPDELLRRCTKVNINGEIIDLTKELREIFDDKNKEYANKALRVLGYAYKIVAKDCNILEEENNLVFCGISGMIDPPRQEAKDAVKECKKAGIRVVMITGDHITTASAIAKEIGILDENSTAIEGARINDYSDEEFREIVKHTNVFARVSPEHKVRIVSAIIENNNVAAMTGDGVNDAPALKKADIGIAMGITGTDVSKEAADMILTDDNFVSIVHAVKEGRIIYSNIRKFVGFLLSCNIGEIMIIFFSILVGWPVPLLPIQLLWVNLITDSFPAFALGLEKGENGIMNRKPRKKDEPILNKKMRISIIFQSVGLTVGVLTSFYIGMTWFDSVKIGRTFCFMTLIVGEMLRAYSARSEYKSIFKMKVFSNKYLNYSVLLAIVLLLIVIYVPSIANVFGTYALNIEEFSIAIVLGLVPTVFGEISKVITKNL